MKYKIFISFILAFLSLFFIYKKAYASEGIFELRSTTKENIRCFVASLMMQDFNFRILVSCRDLIYPAEPTIFNYILWATPKEGGNSIKLGELGKGRVDFKTNKAFTSLFVTTEQNINTKSPGGNVVMRGSLQPITFLERPTTPTPSLAGQKEVSEETQAQKLSTKDRLITGLKRAGLVSLLALVAVIGLVFVITRGRG